MGCGISCLFYSLHCGVDWPLYILILLSLVYNLYAWASFNKIFITYQKKKNFFTKCLDLVVICSYHKVDVMGSHSFWDTQTCTHTLQGNDLLLVSLISISFSSMKLMGEWPILCLWIPYWCWSMLQSFFGGKLDTGIPWILHMIEV